MNEIGFLVYVLISLSFKPTFILSLSLQAHIKAGFSFASRHMKLKLKQDSGYGIGATQDDFMINDNCIVVDENDNILMTSNKKDAHSFTTEQPRGLLHRAFSVFLFNSENKLLLQQRASNKITFPNVWSNTCCSHPLSGLTPTEIDSTESINKGIINGIKNGAIRKLKHELGIVGIQPDDLKYLTRLHYWAADVLTHGELAPWGEHEIDYILFCTMKTECRLSINFNPEEVRDVQFVDFEELLDMIEQPSKYQFSPWFKIIVKHFLSYWWADLRKTMDTDCFVDYKSIHRFDPTSEFMGGAGNAREYLGSAQSLYSKIE